MTNKDNIQTYIEALIERMAKLAENDFDEATSILRDTAVVARTTFGKQSPHLEDIYNIVFRPRGIIANTGHYLNTEAWANGVMQLNRVLDSMKYEYEIIQQKPKELAPPSTVTIPWLFRHLSLSVWFTFVGLLFAAFLIGFAVAKNNLLNTLFSNIRDAISHSEPMPKENPIAPPTATQNKQIEKTATKAETAEKTSIKP